MNPTDIKDSLVNFRCNRLSYAVTFVEYKYQVVSTPWWLPAPITYLQVW